MDARREQKGGGKVSAYKHFRKASAAHGCFCAGTLKLVRDYPASVYTSLAIVSLPELHRCLEMPLKKPCLKGGEGKSKNGAKPILKKPF